MNKAGQKTKFLFHRKIGKGRRKKWNSHLELKSLDIFNESKKPKHRTHAHTQEKSAYERVAQIRDFERGILLLKQVPGG